MKKTQPKKTIKLKNHKIHLMKRTGTSVEEIRVQGYYLQQTQKRMVTTYTCICDEQDRFYNQPNMQGFQVDQYIKAALKK